MAQDGDKNKARRSTSVDGGGRLIPAAAMWLVRMNLLSCSVWAQQRCCCCRHK